MGVRSPPVRARPRFYFHPSLGAAGLTAAVILVVLLINGRPIPAGDTRPTERVAASLAHEFDFDLDEYPDIVAPFAREVGGRRVSIYPVLSAVLAAPVFALANQAFKLDETGHALAGKLAASLFAALAAGLLFLAVGHRHGEHEALWTAVVFALGTSVWSTSQALWQHPAAVLFLSLAALFMSWAEEDDVWVGRAGLPLSLAVAARHADLFLALVLALALALRWPRKLPALVAWGLPGVVFVLGYQWWAFGAVWRHGFSGSLGRFSEPWGSGQLGLLVSPAKGWLVFTPVVLVAVVGLLRSLRSDRRWMAAVAGLAVTAHWVAMGRWSEWHGGVSFGPRLMTDALPLLFLFLPEGWSLMKRFATVLAVLSVGVQAVGAFAYDGRWERLHQHPPAPGRPELWNVLESPLVQHAVERVFKPAVPALSGNRVLVREYPFVLLGPKGSRVDFAWGRPVVSGADATFGNVHLQRGARVDGDALRLAGRWDALFLRVLPGARLRRLELRVSGHGQGTLYVGERTFWSDVPRWRPYSMRGAFQVRHAYHYPESGGADVLITVGKGGGRARIDRVALVGPGQPDDPIRLP